MSTPQLEDRYPGERTVTETSRLRTQHELITTALGDFLLAPLDVTRQDLRILDVGTADGHFLACVRARLAHPSSAALLGTDVAAYPNAEPGVTLHDFRQPFPADWAASFDFVQLRCCLASVPGAAAVDLVRRLLALLRPAGALQLVDGLMAPGPLGPDVPPSARFTRTVGNFLAGNGMDPSRGPQVADILAEAGGDGVRGLGAKYGPSRIGKGAPPGADTIGWDWLRGMFVVMAPALTRQKDGPLSADDWERLRLEVFDEAEKDGFDVYWYAAWATKV